MREDERARDTGAPGRLPPPAPEPAASRPARFAGGPGGARRFVPLAAVAAVALALAAQAVLIFGVVVPYWMIDFAVYRGAAQALLHDVRLYELGVDTAFFPGMMYTYTPFFAVMMVPAALVPAAVAQFAWTTAGYLALAASIWLVLRITGVTTTRQRTTALVTAGLICAAMLGPVQFNVLLGQVNLFLVVLVLLDFLPSLPERYRGIATGIAAGIKLTPLFFVAYLFFTGRRRAAFQALGSFAATALVGFALLPTDSRAYWFHGVFFDSARAVPTDVMVNHSLPGFFARLVGERTAPDWSLLLAAAATAACLAAAVWAHRRGHDVVGLLVIAFAAQLVSPVTWVHHCVWVVPALVWLATVAWRQATPLPRVLLGLVVLWYLAPVWSLGHRIFDGVPFQHTPTGNLLVTLTGTLVPAVVAIALLPVWLRRLRPPERAEVARPEVASAG
ncbi:glycosyltransferase 87 family protein [Saccharothrix xinjiangensis]|uniref:Glycosyltransferase 87 family protein n=1 Tax=Saccharothrix xinjiangensis TaxID=204798 RepID=A0ABV9Y4U6_9PSEU